MPRLNFFKQTSFAELFENANLVAIDIGSRGGFENDLLPAAWAIEGIGFEPDPDAFEQLRRNNPDPWRKMTFYPKAIGSKNGEAILHIPRSPEGASIFKHNEEIIEEFGHEELFTLKKSVSVRTMTLDTATQVFEIPEASYLKLDVEGAELAVLEGAFNTLRSVLAVKTEVAFIEQRKSQPLAWEVAEFLYGKGFILMDIMNIHHWRRRPVASHPYITRYPVPYSRGCPAQCDLLFIKEKKTLDTPTDSRSDFTLRLLLISMVLGYFDYAVSILRFRPDFAHSLEKKLGINIVASIGNMSKRFGRLVCMEHTIGSIRNFIPLFRSLTIGLPKGKNLIPY